MSQKRKVLITGALGGLAEVVARRLAPDYEITGVDLRSPEDHTPSSQTFPGKFHQANYSHRKMAEIFRMGQFDALLHLGRIPVTSKTRRSTRFNVNVLGTRSLLSLCRQYGVKQVIVFSTFHVYGAHPRNHLYLTEEDPLLASHTFPEIADSVELDHVSTMFALKHPEITTTVLRPVNVIGHRIRNQISQVLRSQFCPMVMGYDPMLQFIHEADTAEALTLALTKPKAGVYNLAGEGLISFSRSIEMAGGTPVPIPPFFTAGAIAGLRLAGIHFPKHLTEYFKYPVIISDQGFRRDFGYKPAVSTLEALRSLRGDLIS